MTQPSSAPPSVHAPSIFLGALASEVNEPDVLPGPFATIAGATERVVAAVRREELPADEAATYLARLRLTDARGCVWTLGATSMRWYRRTPGRPGWRLAAPPARADEQAEASATAAIESVPDWLRTSPQDRSITTGYGVDPLGATHLTAPGPWEYEPGEDRYLARRAEPPAPV